MLKEKKKKKEKREGKRKGRREKGKKKKKSKRMKRLIFLCQICTNYRSLLTNMVPFPRLHFFIHGLALPLHSPSYSSYSFFSLSSLIEQLFHHKNLMATCSPQFSQYYTLTSMFRGNTLSACDIESRMYLLLLLLLLLLVHFFYIYSLVHHYVMRTQPILFHGYLEIPNVHYL